MTSQVSELAIDSQAADRSIRVDRLSLAYHDKRVLEDLSLTIAPGKITALIGPSGCGKSSLLCSLNRLTDLLPGCHVSGAIRIGELDVHHPKTDVIALRRRVGMIFQKPNPFPLSIRNNLDLPLREHGVARREERQTRIEEALREVGLWSEICERLDEPALRLSGGQQQRLCIARALVLEPEILLMDEPCSSLDPISTGVIEDLITGFRQRMTIVIVTHHLAQARRISDQTAFFWWNSGLGQLIEHGSTKQLFQSPRDPLTEAYVNGRAG